MTKIDTATRRARLVARHHLARSATSAAQVAADLVALHSSDPLTPHLALWARVAGYRPEDLSAEMSAQGALRRLHAMRRTLWVAHADEVGMLDAAVGRDIAAKERKRLLGWVEASRPDAVAWLEDLEGRIIEAVGAQPGIATRELTSSLPELATKIWIGSGKWVTETAIASRLLFLMAMDLRISRASPLGSWKSSQYGWVLPDAVEEVHAPIARAQLVRRYVDRFGPVTTADVQWWTGLTLTRTRSALQDAGAVEVEIESGSAWDSPDPDPDPSEAAGLALLPGLDPTPMGYKERDWFLGSHQAALFDRNGNIGPTIWVDGRIVGGWAVGEDGVVKVEVLEDVGSGAEAGIAEQADALTAWLEGTPVTPRFRTPLEKALAAN